MIPPKKTITTMFETQPSTGIELKNFLYRMKNIATTLMSDIIQPILKMKIKGFIPAAKNNLEKWLIKPLRL
jgi:hypothetical protein